MKEILYEEARKAGKGGIHHRDEEGRIDCYLGYWVAWVIGLLGNWVIRVNWVQWVLNSISSTNTSNSTNSSNR